ncbi:MAG: hypothetical protein R3E42_01780 [Burkholderiaceae bacterium]
MLLPASGRLYAGVSGVGSWVEEKGMRRAIRCRRTPLPRAPRWWRAGPTVTRLRCGRILPIFPSAKSCLQVLR